MKAEQFDKLKAGDVIFHLNCNADGTKVSMIGHSPLFVRSVHNGTLMVSHSPSWNCACWPIDATMLLHESFALEDEVFQAATNMASALIFQRSVQAKKAMEAAIAEYEKITYTTADDLIDRESLAAGISKAKEDLKNASFL